MPIIEDVLDVTPGTLKKDDDLSQLESGVAERIEIVEAIEAKLKIKFNDAKKKIVSFATSMTPDDFVDITLPMVLGEISKGRLNRLLDYKQKQNKR